ncbi:RNase P modulator RnpM [Wansuia hejianensis]|uniref:YlxR family protein n=1 Tax=Wansuia hejianensis TaxID=2763667 RepID=A0A926F213_9FIRM|nr:YlxR family protein [Wansuia hejianensis]MBC8590509.1 YlxR family protein [Wansuia hejianensis]
MKKKKIPLRKCISCGENKPKKELIRVVRTNDGDIVIDTTGKVNGRGAYLCSNINCLETSAKTNKLSRSLQTEVKEEIYKELKEFINESSK